VVHLCEVMICLRYNCVDGITEAYDSSIQIYDMQEHAVPYYS